MQNTYQFISDKGVFSLPGAADYSDLYFPVAGECGIKSAVTPTLGGDCKLDQNTFLLEPEIGRAWCRERVCVPV